MKFEASDLERVFRDCFFEPDRTILVGGGDEPLYLPSSDLTRGPHRIVYREDYIASALHEVAHWCLAGARRRRLEDYGYWYAPDGRNADEQAAFERVEARPQALEWILSDACRFEFNLSADNLDAGFGPSAGFAEAVAGERRRFLTRGLPPRAQRFRAALASELAQAAEHGSERARSRCHAALASGSSDSIRRAAPATRVAPGTPAAPGTGRRAAVTRPGA